jgi:hypothetical protein
MDLLPTAANIAALYDGLLDATWPLPVHVIKRLAALLAGETPLYIDGSLAPTDRGQTFDGTIVVFSETRVAIARMTGSRDVGSTTSEGRTVEASVWNRHRLIAADLSGEDAARHVNGDSWWTGEYGDLWPHSARVTLRYEGEQSIRIPMGEPPSQPLRKALSDFWPHLLADLSS